MSKKKLHRLFLILIPCVLLDQLTKYFARKIIRVKSIVVIKNVLVLEYLENRGAAWGSFQNRRAAFIILTLVLSAVVLYAYRRLPDNKRMKPMSYLFVFILAGAVGNFIDRVLFGYVTDFIYFELIHFPVFNVADIYVTCSTVILAFLVLFYYKDEDFEWLKFKKR